MSEAAVIPAQEWLSRAEGYITDEFKRARLSGAYAVVAGGAVVLEGAVGIDSRTGRPMTPDTPFEIGSVTKSLTALAILQLRDQGLLNLDDPVQRHLPWFRVADAKASERITIRHLLSHTSGLSPTSQGVVARDYDRIWPSIEAGVRELRTQRLKGEPGTRFAYANMGYAAAGAVVEAVSGRPWAEYIQSEILDPLGMRHSAADFSRAHDLQVATPHGWIFGRPAPVGHRALGPYLAPAGSTTVCSVRDLARYALACLGAAPIPKLSPGSLEEAQTGAVKIDENSAYGLGWVEQLTEEGQRVVWHNGGTEGSASVLMLLPAEGIAVILLCNTATRRLDPLATNLLAVVRGEDPKPVEATFEIGKVISLAWMGFMGLSLFLLLWLGLTIRADLAASTPAGWGRFVWVTLLAALPWWMALSLFPNMGAPPLSRLRLWPIDSILGMGGLLLSSALWWIWALVKLIWL
ncbi:MAG: serine hydrolase domain-containing protein [Bacillota bacterium]